MKGVTRLFLLDEGLPKISIHKPVKGVTKYDLDIAEKNRHVSIHTPVKGVTLPQEHHPNVQGFQSTHP